MIGVSLGSLNTVVGVKKGPNIDIILTSTSKRQLPSMVTFTDKERVHGETSKELAKSHLKSTVLHPRRYLGLKSDNALLDHEVKHSILKPTVEESTGKIAFRINHKGKEEFYYPERIMGTFLNKLKTQWISEGYNKKDICVSVPDYYNCHERAALLDSMKIADLNPISLINESSAIGVNYGLFRRGQIELEGKGDVNYSRLVAFVDMGECDTKVIYGKFTRDNQRIISVTTDRFCGARDLDLLVMERLSHKFEERYKINPMTSDKSRLRMLEAIAKARKILTGNTETNIHIDCLMQDEDLDYLLTRSEFESVIQPVLQKFKAILIESLKEANISLEDLHSVEMVGDTIRVPSIQKAVQEIFSKEISKTLAPDECIAKGVTLLCAMSSPLFVTKNYTFEHYNNHTILIEYPYLTPNGTIEARSKEIIRKGESFPARKHVKFTNRQLPKDSTVRINLSYKPQEVNYLKNPLIASYSITLPCAIESDEYELVLNFYLNEFGIPTIEKACLIEHLKDNQLNHGGKDILVKQRKYSDACNSNRSGKKEHICKILSEFTYGLKKEILDENIQKERIQEEGDLQLLSARSKRNEIEQFIYNTRSKIDTDLKPYLKDSEERESLLNLMTEIEEWLYSNEDQAECKSILDSKSSPLDELGKRIYSRVDSWTEVENAILIFESTLKSLADRVSNDQKSGSKLTLDEITECLGILKDYEQKLFYSRSRLEECLSRVDSPPVDVKEIKDFKDVVSQRIKAIYDKAVNRVFEERRKLNQNTQGNKGYDIKEDKDNKDGSMSDGLKEESIKMDVD